MDTIKIFVILTTALHCDGISILKQLEHVASRRAESQRGIARKNDSARRFGMLGSDTSVILGAPSYSSHLPEAEPILPGHTLLRPAMGMLKSAVKFPHREHENGAGVYGHYDNLGIRYDGKNERVLYSGFRRMLPNRINKLILVVPNSKKQNLRQRPVYVGLPKVKKERLTNYIFSKYFTPKLTSRNYVLRRNHTLIPEKGIQIIGRDKSASRTVKTDLRTFIGVIKSLRRDQTIKQEGDVQNETNSTNWNFLRVPESKEEIYNKSKLFWDTKDSFNHIKIKADAPEFSELIPSYSGEKTRDWWFYHQSDFGEFEER